MRRATSVLIVDIDHMRIDRRDRRAGPHHPEREHAPLIGEGAHARERVVVLRHRQIAERHVGDEVKGVEIDVARVHRPATEQQQAGEQTELSRVAGHQRPAAMPAARPVAQAQEKLWPPIGPKASSISPQRYNPGTRLLSSVLGSTSVSATPPPVTSAFL